MTRRLTHVCNGLLVAALLVWLILTNAATTVRIVG